MEDLEGNVNRAGAEKKFQAVFFIFNLSFSLSKKNSVANSNDTVAYIVKISYKQLYSGTYLKKKTLAYAITQWLLRLYIHNELKTKKYSLKRFLCIIYISLHIFHSNGGDKR